MDIPGFLLVHEASVEPFTGEGAFGATFGDAVTVACFIEEKRRRVKAKDGAEVVSETTLYTRLDQVDVLPVGSRVTYAGRAATVLDALRRDGGGLATPDHLEVLLR